MKIELEIPDGIVRLCRELNIADVNIPIIFKDYCQDKLGVYVGVATNDFKIWTETTDNITDYVMKTKKACGYAAKKKTTTPFSGERLAGKDNNFTPVKEVQPNTTEKKK